jgi:hypothetical protein
MDVNMEVNTEISHRVTSREMTNDKAEKVQSYPPLSSILPLTFKNGAVVKNLVLECQN